MSALTPPDVQRILNEWSRGGLFRMKDLGERASIREVVARGGFVIDFSSQYEERRVTRERAPFAGGPVDDRGPIPGAWDVHVAPPETFQSREQQVPLAGSERVVSCAGCQGRGDTPCGTCQERGKTKCEKCAGLGTKESTRRSLARDAAPALALGFARVGNQEVREDCKRCTGGHVSCGAC